MPNGFVKLEDESNDDYMLSFTDYASEAPDSWLPIIREAHQKLSAIDPNYQIAQIKEKFGGLRYYYDSEFPWDSPERIAMEQAITDAEQAVRSLVAAARDLREQDKSNLQTWDDEGGNL